MKKLIFILIFFAGNASAQVQGQKPDSMLVPPKTDSSDFSNSSYKRDNASSPFQTQPQRRDSLPVDDRKPKGPPKK